MSSTLTVQRRAKTFSGGVENDVLTIKETKTNLQGTSSVLLERSSHRVSTAPPHVLSQLCPHFKLQKVLQPPHSVPSSRPCVFSRESSLPSMNEKSLCDEITRVRNSPQFYLDELRSRKREIVGSTLWTKTGATRLTEGAKVLDEAIDILEQYTQAVQERKIQPTPAELVDSLCLAAQDLVADVGPKGLISQRGSDGSNVSERTERYATWVDCVGEIAAFGVADPVDVVCHTLIDDGVPERFHRKLLLDGGIARVGVCLGGHSSMGCMAVVVLAGQAIPKKVNAEEVRRILPAIQHPKQNCKYCFGLVDLRQCVYGASGHVYHRNCFLCKICKSTLRQTFVERLNDDGDLEVFCKDCLLFRHCPACSGCGKKITRGIEEYSKDSQPLCELCFLDNAKQLAEGYNHDDSEGELK